MGSSPSTGSQLEYRLLGVGVIALFIVYGIAARSINTAGMTDPLGAAYVPTMLAIIGTVLGALMVIASFFKREHRAVAPIELTTERPPNLRLALAILSLPFLWPLLLPHTGYLLTTSVLVSLLLYLLNVRDWRAIAGLSVGLTAVLWVVFAVMFGVELPAPQLWG